jgi:hypothetical protein
MAGIGFSLLVFARTLTIHPSNDGHWEPHVGQTAVAGLSCLGPGPVDDVAHAPILESVTRVPVTVGPSLKLFPDAFLGDPVEEL